MIDPEGDGWKVELVSDPSNGIVVLGSTSQANRIGSTQYTYTPDEGYTGDDEFVVKVTSTGSGFNILHPSAPWTPAITRWPWGMPLRRQRGPFRR